jgi:hypothetical protein
MVHAFRLSPHRPPIRRREDLGAAILCMAAVLLLMALTSIAASAWCFRDAGPDADGAFAACARTPPAPFETARSCADAPASS